MVVKRSLAFCAHAPEWATLKGLTKNHSWTRGTAVGVCLFRKEFEWFLV